MRWLLALAPALLLGAAGPAPQVSPERLSATARTLGSPAFEGRGPGTRGEDVTVPWLIAQFRAAGVQPGGPNSQWVQEVPLVHTRLGAGTIRVGGAAWTPGTDVYLTTVRPADRVRIADAPMVFVGYGANAPERGWDDFKGVDLRGKVAVFLVNDPDFAALPTEPVAGRFGGRRMTYYGRWTYKYEEAARRGAIAALIVHETVAAGYGWNTVIAPGGENYDVVRGPADQRVALQGWIAGDAATRLFAAAGLDLAAERQRARRADFHPVELRGQHLDADFAVKVEQARSRNVLARLPGRTHPDETVMYGAHWDAYGVGAADAQGRTIRPGANDDGLGVAAVLEMARLFAAGPRPDRSIVFALWTGEERGLLGSEYYARSPVWPLAKTVANLTFDILQTGGPSRDVLLIGAGQTTAEDRFAAAVAAQGRTIAAEALPERGLYYRADHFSVARRGVPSLLLMAIGAAPDLVAGGRPAGQAWLDAYMACYHQTCDQWSSGWDLRGAAADAQLFYDVGHGLANSRDWPDWRAGVEFKALRAQTAAARR